MIQFCGIGQCALLVGDTRVSPASETLFALTVYLVMEAGRAIPRTELTELLWPVVRDDRSAHRLRQLIYRLNQAGAGLRCDRGTVELPRDGVESDVARLKERRGDAKWGGLVEEVDGAFLPGFEPRISETFSEWLERQRDLVSRSLTRALSEALVLKRNRGDWNDAERLAIRCLRLDPLNEEATLVLAEATAAAGSKSRALSILSRYVEELGPSAGELAKPATVLRQRIANWSARQRRSVWPVPFAGREEELSELFRRLSATQTGLGSAVIVSGEQGIGKSRLISELVARAAIRNHAVAYSTCEPHDRRRVLATIVNLTTTLLDTPGALGSSPQSLAQLRRLVTQQLPPAESAEDSELVASQLRGAFVDLLDSVCAETPLVIAIEDAQWLDPTSHLFLLRSARELLARRVLLVLTTRDTRTAAELLSAIPSGPVHIRLGPLQSEASAALVQSALAQVPRKEGPEFIDWCVAYAGGNPLYLMQLAAHATSTRGRFSPPASLRSLLTDRLAQLSPTAKGLLRACCVLGRNATFPRLEKLLGEKRAAFVTAIDELERVGFVTTYPSGMSYRNALLARVALDDLTPAARRTLHQHAAELLDQESAKDGAATLWESARHWEEAGRPEHSVTRLRACAQLSLSMGAPAEAASMLTHAYELARECTDRAAILHEKCVALQLADRWEDVAATVSQIERLVLTAPTRVAAHPDLETLRLEAGWHTGKPFKALLSHALRSANCPEARWARRLRAAALVMILADNLCDASGVHELFRTLEGSVTRDDGPSRSWHHVRMIYHAAFGSHSEVRTAARNLVVAAAEDGNPAALTRCLRHAAIAQSISHSIYDAIALATEAHAVAEKSRLSNAIAASATTLSSFYLRLDQIDKANSWYARALQQPTTNSSPMASTVRLGIGARLAIQAADFRAARDLVSQVQRVMLHAGSVRANAELAAMRMELALHEERRVPSISQLHNLERLHQRARAFSGHDYFLRVMIDALQAKGLSDRAAQLAEEYFGVFRREVTEAPPRLHAAICTSQRRVAEAPRHPRTRDGKQGHSPTTCSS